MHAGSKGQEDTSAQTSESVQILYFPTRQLPLLDFWWRSGNQDACLSLLLPPTPSAWLCPPQLAKDARPPSASRVWELARLGFSAPELGLGWRLKKRSALTTVQPQLRNGSGASRG